MLFTSWIEYNIDKDLETEMKKVCYLAKSESQENELCFLPVFIFNGSIRIAFLYDL